ncbi:MAG TPA: hypothetical protein PLV42_03130 [bacterium]|nr:hypothetical protein [bacterium]
MKNMMLFLCAVFLLPVVLIGVEGTPLGGEPYASWEEGSSDYFVMFNSLIDDQITLYGETTNRQADTCILESSFVLENAHTPDDAIVAQAYLIWMGAVDPEKFDVATDNAVHLKFSREDGYTYEEDIVAGDTAKMLGDTTDPFLFQSVQFTADITTGCTDTNPGTAATADVAFFTYRIDITPFFQKIFDDNLLAGTFLVDRTVLPGTYTFSGLDCTDNDIYKCNTTMVSNWSILVVYKSEKVNNQKIYLYPGFAYMQGETATANVSGFDLPKNPFLRLTAMTAEGDVALVDPNLPSEFIYIKGENATSTYLLTNDCNPFEEMHYEIYNSNSSLYGWDPDNEQLSCLTGGIDGQYFGIDADTFLLDPKKDVNLQEHLKLDATNLDVTLSVNQDAILSNYLILSVDNRRGPFDIPEEASAWPYGREKKNCSCRNAEDPADVWCEERPMYYLIKVQNWGTNIANNVTVIDDLSPMVDYIPGTTEMATKFDEYGDGTDWAPIPDKPGWVFPLSGDGYKVADMMDICDQATWTCQDTRLLRFKVKPKSGTPKALIISNLAIIKEAESSQEYRTNSNFELKLYKGNCIEKAVCPEPKKSECGGDIGCEPCIECDETIPCPEGYICDTKTDTQYVEDDFSCKPDKNITCTNAKVSYDIGINSPDSELSSLIIPASVEDLVIGQIKIYAENCPETKAYKFSSLRTGIFKSDTLIQLSNIELIYDRNGSGMVDPDEEVVATVANPDNTGAYFVIDKMKNRFAGNENYYFLIRADVAYGADEVPGDATFRFAIENKNAFAFEDAGNAQPDGDPIEFAEFMLEPTTGGFIFAKGKNDPGVPPAPAIIHDIPMLQLWLKAIDAPNTVKEIQITIPQSTTEEYVTFGHSINSLRLYVDTEGDGIPDGEPILYLHKFSDEKKAIFKGTKLEELLSLKKGEEKFLIINGDLNYLEALEKARVEITQEGVVLTDTSEPLLGLPVRSKTFYYEECSSPECQKPIIDCCCGCSLVF